jgi:hypothetical protein
VRKTNAQYLSRHLILKTDHFAKTGSGQRHSESTQKVRSMRFFRRRGAHGLRPGKKTALFAPFIYKNQHFTKTGSGQKKCRFPSGHTHGELAERGLPAT